jgi:hypothetical protein
MTRSTVTGTLSCVLLAVAGCKGHEGQAGNFGGAAAPPDPANQQAAGAGAADGALTGLRVRFVGGTFESGETELSALITKETGAAPTRIHATGTPPALASEDLADEDVLVLDNLVRVYSAPEATLLADWVAAGHGLIVMGGFADDSTRVANVAASYGVGYVPRYIASSSPGAYVTALSLPALTGGVSSLRLYGGFRLTTSNQNAVAFATIPPDPVGFAVTQGTGRVVIWGDDWLLSDLELLRIDEDKAAPTAVFWKNALAWAAARD